MGDMFGGLMKGLSSVLPQDDPGIKQFTSMTKVNDLKEKEQEIYAEAGKRVMAEDPGKYSDLADKLKVVQMELNEAQAGAQKAQDEAKQAEAANAAAMAERTCPQCGHVNDQGVNFCSECGTKLGALKCPACGVEVAPGTKFCGECGAKIGE